MDKNIESIVNGAVDSLIEELKQGKSDRLVNYLKFCSKFYNYSANNTLLIYFQMPEASRVAGLKAWNKLGYRVKKGEKHIKVLAPQEYIYIEVDGERIFYNQMTKAQKENKKEHKKGKRFVPVPVFDMSQVEKVNGEKEDSFFTQLGDTHKEQYLNLIKVIESQEIKVTETNTGSAEGVSYGGRIEIKNSIDYNNKLLTLIHEFAHEILDKGAESDRDKTTREIRECRAEAVSYIVGNYLGLHNPFASDYLICWGNTPDSVKKHLEAILKATKHIIKSIEEYNSKEIAA